MPGVDAFLSVCEPIIDYSRMSSCLFWRCLIVGFGNNKEVSDSQLSPIRKWSLNHKPLPYTLYLFLELYLDGTLDPRTYLDLYRTIYLYLKIDPLP